MPIVLTVVCVAFLAIAAIPIVSIFSSSDVQMPALPLSDDFYRANSQPLQPARYPKESAVVSDSVGDVIGVSRQIRAGFYVNWDQQAFSSLREHISELTMVMPEWLFIPDKGDTVICTIDTAALHLMRTHGVEVVPMVSNFFNGQWNSANIERIIAHPASRKNCIASILNALQLNQMQGVNIDFEDLNITHDRDLIQFQKELFETLKPLGYVITQDVVPNNVDYDLSQLQHYNDYLMLMAYDQHYGLSKPGPIADRNWVRAIIHDICRQVPPQKLIVGIPTYGFDWVQGCEGQDVSYLQAMVNAKHRGVSVLCDASSSNLNYSYKDQKSAIHDVWFTDAVTCFNAMREAADSRTAGVALWRVGGEDPRIWNFFGRELDSSSLHSSALDLKIFQSIPPVKTIEYDGKGEVLDAIGSPKTGTASVKLDPVSLLITEQHYSELPTSYLIKKDGRDPKKIVLTFDDGPSEEWTPQILDILKREHVPACFFVVGLNIQANLDVAKRIYDEGHEIGNHTFTHVNAQQASEARTTIELGATRRIIEALTDHSTTIFRPTYSADAEPQVMEELLPITRAREAGYYTVGESIDPRDWEKNVTVQKILQRVDNEVARGSIIVMHDAGGDRSATVAALPILIKNLRARGYEFSSLSSFIGKTRDDIMPKPRGADDTFYAKINRGIINAVFHGWGILLLLFYIAIVLSILRITVVALLAWIQNRRDRVFDYRELVTGATAEMSAIRKSGTDLPVERQPMVSILVPAHNEELNIVRTIQSLCAQDYAQFEVIVVDDGSTDATVEHARTMETDSRVRVVAKLNGGKASALNCGVSMAKGDFLLCVDADTQLAPDALKQLVACVRDDVGSVAGNVKVGNENQSIFTRWQAIEYITSQNFDRCAFDLLNCITVVPGAIGLFRTSCVKDAGGFSSDTLAEDCDITINILKHGWRVRYAKRAHAFTEAPETMSMFLKQRFRWTFGIMQSFWKHRDAIFRKKYKNLGFIALPNSIVFQFMHPVLAPVADLIMVLSLIGSYREQAIISYLIFTLVDLVGAVIAFRFEGEKLHRLWLLFPQRLVYRQLMYYVLFKSFFAAMQGRFVEWGKRKRTGTVVLETSR